MPRLARALFLLCAVCAGTRLLAAQPPNYTDVRDFGAVGNGVADDTKAIQDAIAAACKAPNPTYHVYLPPGKFRVTSSIVLSGGDKHSLMISGAGGRRFGMLPARTTLLWDGEDGGVLLNSNSNFGLRLLDVCLDGDLKADGERKAGVLLQANYQLGHPSAEFFLERVGFRNGITGLECSGQPDCCNSDMTLIDVNFDNFTQCFHTRGGQNVNFIFIRPEISNCDIGLYFEHGGSVECKLLCGANVGTAIKIGHAETNTGSYAFDGIKVECYVYKGKRTTILDMAGGNGVVNITNLNTSAIQVAMDKDTPIFKLAGSVQVFVNSSLIWSQQVAAVTGVANAAPSWITFDSCRFGHGPDPRATILCDQFSGYELRNCASGNGQLPPTRTAIPQVTPPLVTDLAAVAADHQVDLTWTDVEGETGYRIERCLDDGKASWTKVADVAANTSKYACTGLTPDTKYCFRIFSLKGSAYAFGLPVSVATKP